MREIPLARGRGVALVDDEDFDVLSALKWHRHPGGYATRSVGPNRHTEKRTILMHRQIMAVTDRWQYVDHISGDKLDNRRENLRVCTPLESSWNLRKHRVTSSRFKGVRWEARCKKWQAEIGVNGRSKYLGVFDTEEEAAHVHDEAARLLRGEYARLNFPREGEQAA